METQNILLDTSILIDHFRKVDKSKTILFWLAEKYRFYISAINAFEIKIGIKNERQKRDYMLIMRNIEFLPIDESCIEEAVNIYKQLKKKNKLIDLADLLVAATAVSNSLSLATLNKKHFENISQVELISLPRKF